MIWTQRFYLQTRLNFLDLFDWEEARSESSNIFDIEEFEDQLKVLGDIEYLYIICHVDGGNQCINPDDEIIEIIGCSK